MLDIFHKLPSAALVELAASLRDGDLSIGIAGHAVQQIAGSSATEGVVSALRQLHDGGWSSAQIGDLIEAIIEARCDASSVESQFDLVLTGPDVTGIPTRDTLAVMHTLIEEADNEVILVGYAIYDGKKMFHRLAERVSKHPELTVWFCVNIQRGRTDTSLSSEIVRRFAMDFSSRHWPWDPKPAVYYDPRSLEQKGPTGASLHAKCLVVDRREALITSANFTEAAQKRNIEAGVIVRYAPFVERLACYFDGLRREHLARVEFPSPAHD